MPGPKNNDVTFVGWLEEFAKLPLRIPTQTLALYRDNLTKDYILMRVSVRATSNVRDAEVQLAFAQGTAESLQDLEGVNTVVNIVDLAKSPKKTLNNLIESTQRDIINLEELKQLKSGTIVSNLTHGVTVDEDGNDLSKPQNPFLKAAGIKFPITDSTGKSIFQTSVDVTPTGPTATYEDRYVAETGKRQDNMKLRSYSNLGQAISNLASTGNSVGDRRDARNDALVQFNRSIGRELNLDLDKTFSYKRIDGTSSVGQLELALQRSRGDIDAIIANNAELSQTLGITQAEFSALDAGTQQYLRSYVKAESFGLKLSADPSVHLDIIDKVNSRPSVYGVQITPHPTDPFGAVTVNPIGTKPIPTNIQESWKNFARPNMSAKDRINAFEGLRTAYIKDGDLTTAWTVATDDLGLQVTGTRYGGVTSKNLYLDDITFEHEKALIESNIWFDVNQNVIRRDILARIKTSPALTAQASSIYATERAAQIAAGATTTTADSAAKLAEDTFWRTKTNDAIGRLSTASKSIDLANNLFYAATTRQILEDIQNGKFVNTAFIATRFLYTFPFGAKSIRASRSAATLSDPNNYAAMTLRGMGVLGPGETPGALVAKKLGLAFESGEKEGLFGLVGWENRAAIQHQLYVPDASGRLGPSGIWKTIVFTHGDAQGFFGKNSIYEELLNLSNAKVIDPLTFLENPGKLNDFITTARSMMPTAAGINPITATNDIEAAAVALGFNNFINKDRLDAFEKNVKLAIKLDPSTGQWQIPWLDKLLAKGKLPKGERWRFLGDIVKNGYSGVAAKKYIGVLNLYNRTANAVRDFLYKSVIWGSFGASIPFIGPYILGPIRTLLGSLGFSEEAGLATVIAKTKFFKRTRLLGRAFGNFLKNPNTPTGRYFIRQVFGKGAANLATKLAGGATGRVVIQILSKLFGALAGAATGGISYLLMFAGGTIWRASIKLMRLDFKGAFIAVKRDIETLFIVAKKVILYPIFLACGCMAAPFVLAAIAILIVLTFFTRYDNPIGGGTYGEFESAKISVSKSVVPVDSDTIKFTITVTKRGDEDVLIESFIDRLTYTPSCDVNSGTSISYGDPAFVGALDVSPTDLSLAFQGYTLTEAEPSITAEITLDGISAEDATYTNHVEVRAADDGSNSATDSAAHTVGGGGCATCPAGWPIQLPIKVTQGPNTSSSHSGAEAVDFAPPDGGGRTVYASHNGIVRMPRTNSECINSNVGYGCVIRLEAIDGSYETIYAHLRELNTSLKDQTVQKGTVLGQMGTTGNSTGPHLHYEFPNVNHQCVAGFPMRLRNVAGDQYVPEDIQRGCIDANCTQIFN